MTDVTSCAKRAHAMSGRVRSMSVLVLGLEAATAVRRSLNLRGREAAGPFFKASWCPAIGSNRATRAPWLEAAAADPCAPSPLASDSGRLHRLAHSSERSAAPTPTRHRQGGLLGRELTHVGSGLDPRLEGSTRAFGALLCRGCDSATSLNFNARLDRLRPSRLHPRRLTSWRREAAAHQQAATG